ncbi:MAG TPA: PIN domain-containing protein [Planctomycetaceae bacterium]|nr:PIN domain-containing protein [Planctomycetaceae bacterium]
MSHFTAVYDACVLYPAPLRDLLMHLAMTGLFRAKWSEQIHEEWIRSLLEQRPDLTRENLQRTRDNMNSHVDGLVTDYESLIPGLSLPDPDDRHVLAAAIRARADVIVTFNLADFPKSTLSQFEIEAQHPDEFIRHLIDLNPDAVCEAARRQRASLKKPPRTVEEFLQALEQQRLPKTVEFLRRRRAFI